MAVLEVPGGRLFYTDPGGGGRPVVFVHPAAATSAGWAHQLDPFAAAGWRCITFDLRGWGHSEVTGSDAGVMSDDIGALADACGLSQFALIGAAYGGFGALDYALRVPERVRALVLATTQGGLSDPPYSVVRERAIPPEIRDLPLHLRELGPSYRAENPSGVEQWRAILHAARHDSAARQRLAQPISLTMLETLHIPTLVLAADADLLAPPALMRMLAAHIPNHEWALIADAGHSAHWERPEAWNQAVLRFLAQHGS